MREASTGLTGWARRGWPRALLLAAALAGGAGAVAAVRESPGAGVLKVRVGGDARHTRVVIEIDRAAEEKAISGKLIEGSEPSSRVILALPHTAVPDDMSGAGAGLVKRWSMDDTAGAARLKLDLARPATVARRFLLPPGDGLNVYRYVIDLEGQGAAPPPTRSAKANAPAPEPVDLPVLPPTPVKKVVVIDAGHGGKDPGAHGLSAHEKDLTLAAARTLRDDLESTGRYKVVLTRETDVFIPLEQRVRIARRANADLFLSLHADSLNDPSVRGATVYTLSDQGTQRVSRKVFGHDDYFIDVKLPGQDPAVNQILLDLTQRETKNQSATFAEMVLDRIGDRTTLLRRSHRSAGYVVLFAPDVPAVLMEMGFITNAEDERALADRDHRRRLMSGVADAIDAYFAQEKRLAMR